MMSSLGLVVRILSNRYHVAIRSRVTGVWLAWLLTSTTTWINFLHTTSDASTAMHLYRVFNNIFPSDASDNLTYHMVSSHLYYSVTRLRLSPKSSHAVRVMTTN